MEFNRAFEPRKGPQLCSVDDQLRRTKESYSALLSADPPEDEVQLFLEQHPWLVPGGRTPSGSSCQLHELLITQPRLPGAPGYQPDFMWIPFQSDAWFPTLIEIERPAKRLFRQDGNPTADFTQARHQLTLWVSWFQESSNVQQFLRFYGIPSEFRSMSIKPRFILVYGRRDEFEDNPTRRAARAQLLNEGQELVSYDRLAPDEDLQDAVTVTAKGQGRFEAKYLMPTFRLFPTTWKRFLVIDHLETVIDATDHISAERRAFLKSRIAEYRAMAQHPPNTFVAPDYE